MHAPSAACRCTDATTCHDPGSHRLPIRFADEPRHLCIDCGDVAVSGPDERCAECYLLILDEEREQEAKDWNDVYCRADDQRALEEER